jgi:phosphate transport system protein
MAIHFFREIEKLKRMVVVQAGDVEENLRRAVRAVGDRNDGLAAEVIAHDREMDRTEVDIEEECLKTLALYQPVAHDLRFIVSILKINHDLERIGDLAVNIAERARNLAGVPPPPLVFDVAAMAHSAQQMVAGALDAFINADLEKAQQIWFSDDRVDSENDRAYALLTAAIRRHPEHLDALLALLSVARNLERIADHATNIAKDVIYLIEGEIVRHRSSEYRERRLNGKPPAAP